MSPQVNRNEAVPRRSFKPSGEVKALGPNRFLRHLSKHAITFLTVVSNVVFHRQYFPPARKHARVASVLSRKRTSRCLLPIDPTSAYLTHALRFYSPGFSEKRTIAGRCMTRILGFDPDTARRCRRRALFRVYRN